MGKWRTTSLFFETAAWEKQMDALFTLNETDREYRGKTFIALKPLYIALEDPTGYTFAKEYLGGWAHFQTMLKSTKLKQAIDIWSDELNVALTAKGIRAMIGEVDMGGRSAASAARWLAEKGFTEKKVVKRKAGAPSKEERAGAMKQALEDDQEHVDAMKRLEIN